MARPLVVIVSGPPATGKTTIGRRIATEFSLPFIYKDGFKERIFDGLGWSDRAWSQRVGKASIDIMYDMLETHLRAEKSLVMDNTFQPRYDAPRFRDLRARYDYLPFEVQCVADGDILYTRFRARAESGDRHPGHGDDLNHEEFEDLLRGGRNEPLDLGGPRVVVDTTDFDAIDYDALFAAIREAMAGEQ